MEPKPTKSHQSPITLHPTPPPPASLIPFSYPHIEDKPILERVTDMFIVFNWSIGNQSKAANMTGSSC